MLCSGPLSRSFGLIAGCEEKCRQSKAQGSCAAFSAIIERFRDYHHLEVPLTLLQSTCREMHQSQENPSNQSPGRSGLMQMSFLDHLVEDPRSGHEAVRDQGWGMVDNMFTDPEFRAGCFAFTHFFKGLFMFFKRGYDHVLD